MFHFHIHSVTHPKIVMEVDGMAIRPSMFLYTLQRRKVFRFDEDSREGTSIFRGSDPPTLSPPSPIAKRQLGRP